MKTLILGALIILNIACASPSTLSTDSLKMHQKESVRVAKSYSKLNVEERVIYLTLNEGFTEETATKIVTQQWELGWTTKMIGYSIGFPEYRTKSVSKEMVAEEWSYDSSGLYLYFENDVLISYQQVTEL